MNTYDYFLNPKPQFYNDPTPPKPDSQCMGGPLDGSRMPVGRDRGWFDYMGHKGRQTHRYCLVGVRWVYLGVV